MEQGQVKGLIKEEQIDRFQENVPAVFIPNDGEHQKIHLLSKYIRFICGTKSSLHFFKLTSHNGPIAIRNFTSGEFQYRPETAHYYSRL